MVILTADVVMPDELTATESISLSRSSTTESSPFSPFTLTIVHVPHTPFFCVRSARQIILEKSASEFREMSNHMSVVAVAAVPAGARLFDTLLVGVPSYGENSTSMSIVSPTGLGKPHVVDGSSGTKTAFVSQSRIIPDGMPSSHPDGVGE